ncbi:MAG: hypothetical protein AB2A00_09340 [Myxococcota bacterium]
MGARWRAGFVALAAITVLHAWWLWPALTGEQSLYLRDVLRFILPFKAEAARALAEGRFPSLSWALMGGMPLWAHPSAEIADPGTLLFTFIHSPHAAHAWSVLLHALATAVGVYLLARNLGVRATVANWAALAFVGAGPVLSGWCIREVPTTSLPFIALGGVLMARRGRGLALVVTAVSVAYALLKPDPPFVASAALLAVVLCWVRAPRGARMSSTTWLGMAGILGLMLCGAFLVPALEVLADSPRSAMADWPAGSTLGLRWIELLAPGGLGIPGASGVLGGVTHRMDPASLYTGSLYVGGTVLLGLLVATLRRRTDRALWGMLLVLLLLSHGDRVPGVGALWSAVHARYPEKLLMATYLCAVLLGARAYQRIRPSLMKRFLPGMAVGVVGVLVAGAVAPLFVGQFLDEGSPVRVESEELLAGQLMLGSTLLLVGAGALMAVLRFRPYVAPSVLVGLAALEGTVSASTTLLMAPTDALTVTNAIPDDTGVFCCSPRQPAQQPPSAVTPVIPRYSAAAENVHRLVASIGVLGGLRYPLALDVGGFEPTAMRVAMTRGFPDDNTALRVLERWGVGVVVSTSQLSVDDVGQKDERDPQPALWWYRLTPSPRVRSASTWRDAPPDAAIGLMAAGHDVMHGAGKDGPGGAASAELQVQRDDSVRAVVHAERDALVIHTATFRKGWAAIVDGVEQGVVPVNVIHMGVLVPAGNHVVEFAYDVPGLTSGIWLSCAGLLLLLLATWLATKRVAPRRH